MRRLICLLLLALTYWTAAFADEGMWLPSLVQKLNMAEMRQMGFQLDAENIYSINNASLKDAVVALDRGSCTAELISPDGLLLTNHHCAFDEIQSHSSVENDYLQDGFWAMTRDQELPNPGKSVTFLVRIEDVTSKILNELSPGLSEKAREDKIFEVSRQLEIEARGNTHYETYVRSFFNSNEFHLFVTETFSDVRLVGAPPQALGKFGGDTDNWMWPRHTADFALFRIYSGPDGKPASFSEDNIPYKSKYFLPVSIQGVKEGDFAMILGYPGSTDRYNTSYGVKYIMEVSNPVRIEVRDEKLRIIDEYMSTSQKARIQYASKYARSSNYYKYSIGQNIGIDNLNVIGKKKNLENEFLNWVNEDAGRQEKYGQALEYIEEAYRNTSIDKAREYLREALISGPEIFLFAYRTLPIYRVLKDNKENAELVSILTKRLSEGMDTYFKDYDAVTDMKITASLMKLYAENVEPEYHPSFYSEVRKKNKGDFYKYTGTMFKRTIFGNESSFKQFLENPDPKILEKDMAFQAARTIFDMYAQLDDLSEEKEQLLEKGNRLFVAGLLEMSPGKNFYPDANSTMRLTYGQILDYQPRDGVVYNFYTTTDGYLEKEIPGDDEFHVPGRMKELLNHKNFDRYQNDKGELVTCFISNNDITGGNSGSPVLNAKGELIGIAFDGNWEAMSGDIAFEPGLQRCINVDIRFVLWIIDIYAGATHLIDEMVIVE